MTASEGEAGLAQTSSRAEDELILMESRWPIALAVSVVLGIILALRIIEPIHVLAGLATWVLSSITIVLVVALIAADTAHVTRRTQWFRRIAMTLTMTILALALVDTVTLIVDLVTGSELTKSAGPLLASGGATWLGNCLVFGLAYWQLDSGGPLARARGEREFPDFAFTQLINPDIAPPDWKPRYVDYLALGFTTSTAFSPTDVMPVSAWAKLGMALQALVALLLVALVISRAINVLP